MHESVHFNLDYIAANLKFEFVNQTIGNTTEIKYCIKMNKNETKPKNIGRSKKNSECTTSKRTAACDIKGSCNGLCDDKFPELYNSSLTSYHKLGRKTTAATRPLNRQVVNMQVVCVESLTLGCGLIYFHTFL